MKTLNITHTHNTKSLIPENEIKVTRIDVEEIDPMQPLKDLFGTFNLIHKNK